MRTVQRAKLVILCLILIGAQACTTAGKIAACVVPSSPRFAGLTYPTISQRLGEYGTTVLSIGFSPDGIASQVAIDHSSGSRRLDTAAASWILQYYSWKPPPASCGPTDRKASVIVAWRLDAESDASTALLIRAMQEADYPAGALERAEEGDTLIALNFDGHGVVTGARVAGSSGYPDLDERALSLVKASPGKDAIKPADTQSLVARWVLPAKNRGGREVQEIHARRLVLEGFSRGLEVVPLP